MPEEWKQEVIEASQLVGKAEQHVADCAERVENAKAKLKAAEKEFDACVRELRDVIDGRDNLRLPFNAPAAGDDWQLVNVDTIEGMPTKAVAAMHAAGLKTVGELSEFLSDGQKTMRDIKGIGERTADGAESAMASFWALVNRYGE